MIYNIIKLHKNPKSVLFFNGNNLPSNNFKTWSQVWRDGSELRVLLLCLVLSTHIRLTQPT